MSQKIPNNNNTHFFKSTFGEDWLINSLLFLIFAGLAAFFPTCIFSDKVAIDIPKVCEEWAKAVLSLSAIFIIANYLTFKVERNRAKHKTKLQFDRFKKVMESILAQLSEGQHDQFKVLGQNVMAKNLLETIIQTEEFKYDVEDKQQLSSYHTIFEKLNNLAKQTQPEKTSLDYCRSYFQNINQYLEDNL
ncbi:MAG: hypothetical protein PSV16_12725 [Flavobacterium sp.]|nr:hypothetical protein [Flavobacterium sp.]